jgi:transcriptional regulator with XRE-family HTH domain
MENRIAQIDELFGQIIAIKRKHLGLDQKQLAQELGINQPALSRIERGESAVNTTMLLKLSEKLKTTPSKLIEEFEREKTRLEQQESVSVVSKKELPSDDASLGKVLLGGMALALLLGAIGK